MADATLDPDAAFNRLLGAIRPQLHRYCARMTGSVIDGEDVVQEAILKALQAENRPELPVQQEPWLFRIAHNAAIDFLRRRARQDSRYSDEELEMIADPAAPMPGVTAASLRTFMHLPAAQRSSVILKDVLGYSVQEMGDITGLTVPAVKAALNRGRTRLREIAGAPDDAPAASLSPGERERLTTYIERFNARDFEAVRDMLAADVRLDVVNRLRLDGREKVSPYFGNYSRLQNWRMALGTVEGRPAILVCDPDDPAGRPRYFVLLGWAEGRLVAIRDYVFARYVMEEAEVIFL